VARHLLKLRAELPARPAAALWSGARAVNADLGEVTMLWTIFVVLLVLWFLGVVSSYTLGGFIHLLLVLAVIAVLVQLISGRRTTI
jgi:Family of unknown function (DUF5670)